MKAIVLNNELIALGDKFLQALKALYHLPIFDLYKIVDVKEYYAKEIITDKGKYKYIKVIDDNNNKYYLPTKGTDENGNTLYGKILKDKFNRIIDNL